MDSHHNERDLVTSVASHPILAEFRLDTKVRLNKIEQGLAQLKVLMGLMGAILLVFLALLLTGRL